MISSSKLKDKRMFVEHFRGWQKIPKSCHTKTHIDSEKQAETEGKTCFPHTAGRKCRGGGIATRFSQKTTLLDSRVPESLNSNSESNRSSRSRHLKRFYLYSPYIPSSSPPHLHIFIYIYICWYIYCNDWTSTSCCCLPQETDFGWKGQSRKCFPHSEAFKRIIDTPPAPPPLPPCGTRWRSGRKCCTNFQI